jgi:hypothetical protein
MTMTRAQCEELIQIEAEEIAEALFEVSYYELPMQVRSCIRARAVAVLWPDQFESRSLPAA